MCKDTSDKGTTIYPPENSDSIDNVSVTDKIDLDEIPLSELQQTSRDKLSHYLDRRKYLPTRNGLFRDWRGILHLTGLSIEYESKFISNQTCELIKLLEEHQPNLSMGTFVQMLREIDRYDVVADIWQYFVEDAIEFKKRERPPEQITILDAELAEQNVEFQMYDAFLLFVDEDREFAWKILEELKNVQGQEVEDQGDQDQDQQFQDSKYLKLCSKLDFLPGITFDHDGIKEFLIKRCERLIVILTPDFINSELNAFLLNLSKDLGLDKDFRKIIPCVLKWCDLPEIFNGIHHIDYERSQKFNSCNFWEKLTYSLVAPCPVVSSSVTDLDSHDESYILEMLIAQEKAMGRRTVLRRGLKFTRKVARRILFSMVVNKHFIIRDERSL